jgi:hypothetical protein
VLAKPTSTLSPERLEALIGSGFLLPRSGRTTVQRGEEVHRRALGLALEAGMAKEAARARYFPGELAISRGSPEEAEPLLSTALEAFEAMDAPLSAGWCHHALGWMAMAADDRRPAQDHFEQVFKLAVEEGLPSCCASTAWRPWRRLPLWPVRRTGPSCSRRKR